MLAIAWGQIGGQSSIVIRGSVHDAAGSAVTGTNVFVVGTLDGALSDSAGNFVHMERMDGQQYSNIHATLLKAQTSLRSRVPTSVYSAQGKNNPAGLTRNIEQYGFFTNQGGIPIVVDGQLIGSVGVGGGAGGAEEGCAIEGLKAAFGDHVTVPVYPAKAAAPAAPAAR